MVYKTMTTREKFAIFFSFSLAGTGVALSIVCQDWEIFQRFGSLIVAVGVWFTFDDLREKTSAAVDKVEELFNKERKEISNYLQEQGKTDEQSKALLKHLHDGLFGKDLPNAIKDTRKRLKFVESSILITGTIIWGFGDLIGHITLIGIGDDFVVDMSLPWISRTSA